MATMIPADTNAFTTSGEGIFYRFLQRCAKPDEKYLAWYQPDIAGREPDFILYSQDAGLIILKSRTGPWTKSSLLIPNSSPFLLRGKWFHKRIPCDKSVSISAKSWTRSNQTATWSRKTLIPMGRSKSRSTAALSFRTSTSMSMNKRGFTRLSHRSEYSSGMISTPSRPSVRIRQGGVSRMLLNA